MNRQNGPMPLTIMAFNLRFASDQPPNSWPQRRPVVAEVIRQASPDFIGTQEGLAGQLSDIVTDCPDYVAIGTGRDPDQSGETTTILYRRSRFAALEFGHYWLSDTPDAAGSRSWGSAFPRMATWVRLHDHEADADLHLVNTHLDHESAEARLKGAALICDRLAEVDHGLPVVVTGDFNADAGADPTYDVFLAAGFTDLREAAAERLGPDYGSFHDYGPPVPGGAHIDWILARGPIVASSFRLINTEVDGQRPSDHFPLVASLELTG